MSTEARSDEHHHHDHHHHDHHHHEHHHQEITVHVNEHPVRVRDPRDTGLEIKDFAIQQGVKIQPDFLLSEEIGNRRARIVGDDEVVTVTCESRFIATAPDDNS